MGAIVDAVGGIECGYTRGPARAGRSAGCVCWPVRVPCVGIPQRRFGEGVLNPHLASQKKKKKKKK